MRQLTGIVSEAIQTFTLVVGEQEAIIKFVFAPVVQQWFFDLTFRDQQINGVKLSLGVLHIRNYNFPFDFIIEDTTNLSVDPFKIDDFSSGRIKMYMLDASEMAEIRGYDVKV